MEFSTQNYFYMVYVYGENSPVVMHKTLKSAEKEAQRLARISKKKAFVLCSVKSYQLNEFIEKDVLPPEIDMPF